MKIGITHRLFLVMFTAAGMAVICMYFIMQWSIELGFRRFIVSQEQAQISRLADRLVELYIVRGNWDFLKNDPIKWHALIDASFMHGEAGHHDRGMSEPPWRNGPPGPTGTPEAKPHPPPPHLPIRLSGRFFLLDALKNPVIAHSDSVNESDYKALRHNNQVVGYLGILPHRRFSEEHQIRFLKEQKLALGLVAGTVVLLAAGFALPLANRLMCPIKSLVTATNLLSAGKFETRVFVQSNDELGILARDFNSLAQTLENNEQSRRQWVADISHELRTPLAVLRGEIEALQDGIRQPTAMAINSLHSETLRLGRLVEDLYRLSLTDLGAQTYSKQELACAPILMQSVDMFRPEFTAKGISLLCQIADGATQPLFADSERLRQLFDNLMENSLKYTDAGGKLLVRLEFSDTTAITSFLDSSPGVPPEALEHVFERLYRVETSRNRSTGGAGLGLAICKNIVTAHDGTIQAMASPLGGLWIKVELPLTGRMI